MKHVLKLGVAVCVIAFSVSAFAGSISSFNYAASLNGLSNTTLHGNYYNTGTVTSASLSFVGNSIFGGLSGTKAQTAGAPNVSYAVAVNLLGESFNGNGQVFRGRPTMGTFHLTQVPEGGTLFSYLAASALALAGGILLAGKQRRQLARN
jgi:hypothetical protein